MKIIAFLGNPGIEYQNTRHNIGFLIGDEILHKRNCGDWKFDKYHDTLFNITIYNNEKILLIKPQSFMNISGQNISYYKNYYKVESGNILVVHDDIDLNIGVIKYKFGGSSGGQNGVKNIILKLGTDQFSRIKIGIGRPNNKSLITNYVLGELSTTELSSISNYTIEVVESINKDFINK